MVTQYKEVMKIS